MTTLRTAMARMKADLESGELTISKSYYHAGRGGFSKGDRLLSPKARGVDQVKERLNGSPRGPWGRSEEERQVIELFAREWLEAPRQNYRSDRVFVTRAFPLAVFHVLHELFLNKFWLRDPDGAVAIYEVEPEGELIPDPDWGLGLNACMVESAVIKRRFWQVTQHEIRNKPPEWFAYVIEPFEDWALAVGAAKR